MKRSSCFVRAASAVLLIALLCSCTVKHVVHPVSQGAAPDADGVYYFLPRTVVDVDVEFHKTTMKQGEFFKRWSALPGTPSATQTERFADIEKAVKKIGVPALTGVASKVSYKPKTPKITARSEADPAACFKVEVAGGYFEDRSLEIKLKEMGVVTAATAKAKDKSFDFALTTIESIGGIAGKFVGFGGPAITASDRDELLDLADEILSGIAEAADKKTDFDLDGVALAVYEKRIAAIDAEIKALSGFFGSKTVEKWTGHYAVRPKASDLGRDIVLVRYGDSGISHVNVDNSVQEWQHAPTKWRTTAPSDVFVLQLRTDFAHDPKLPAAVVAADQQGVQGERGFFYRIPAEVACVVSKEKSGTKEAVSRSVLPVAQLGTVASLPSSTGTPETVFSVDYHEDTGSIESVSITSTGGDPKVAERLGKVASGLIDAKQGAELKELEEREKKLKLKKSIRELEAELTSSDG